MRAWRLILVGIGVGALLAIAVRASRQLRETRAVLRELAARSRDLRATIAQEEATLRTNRRTSADEATPAAAAAAPRNVARVQPGLEHPNGSEQSVAPHPDNPHFVLLNDPDQRAAYLADFRATLEVELGGCFKALEFTPDMIERLKDVLVSQRLGFLELRGIADQHQLDWSSAGRERLRAEVSNANGTELARTLGPELYARWMEYSRTQNVRDLVQRLASTAGFPPTPVTSTQVERVTKILVANGRPPERNPFRGYAINWEAASAELRPHLSPEQIATLGLFVQEQDVGYRLTRRRDLVWAQFHGRSPPK